jgi:hypothetical protein
MAKRQVSPEAMLEEWDAIIANAKGGAKAAANAMAGYMTWYVSEIYLRQTLHPPGAYNQQKGGEPPAYASGTLARAMYMRSALLGVRATALVGNKAPFSRITEFGCVVDSASKDYMSWKDSAGRWYHKQLVHQPHPFMAPATQQAMDDGSLQEAAVKAFIEYDP